SHLLLTLRDAGSWLLVLSLSMSRLRLPAAAWMLAVLAIACNAIVLSDGMTAVTTTTAASNARTTNASSSKDSGSPRVDLLRFLRSNAGPHSSASKRKAPKATGSGEGCASPNDAAIDAACVATDMVEASRPVARLVIQKRAGAIYCTGWLFGCEGHLLTNHHCIAGEEEGESDATAISVEFMAQGASCAQHCDAPSLCPGRVITLSADAVTFSPESELDYVLLKPRLSSAQLQALVADYGFLNLRSAGAVLGEQIFIPQHPAGFGKRIAFKQTGGFGRVTSLYEASCNLRTDNVGYVMETQGGSSGAPVIAANDRSVIGLHFCGGCPNSAIPAQAIVRSLAAAGALPACAISELQWPPAAP
ncbi:hypothetical protein PybrP1_000434, partial [[Pythium] brassicae (nom. inval.)]